MISTPGKSKYLKLRIHPDGISSANIFVKKSELKIIFNCIHTSVGVYFLQITNRRSTGRTEGYTHTRKMLLTK